MLLLYISFIFSRFIHEIYPRVCDKAQVMIMMLVILNRITQFSGADNNISMNRSAKYSNANEIFILGSFICAPPSSIYH
jgi:hypothetical protein